VKFEVPYLKQTNGGKNAITVAPMSETSLYVKSGQANKGDLLATVNVPPEIGSYWRNVYMHIYACEDSKSLSTNGVIRIRSTSTTGHGWSRRTGSASTAWREATRRIGATSSPATANLMSITTRAASSA